MRDFIFLKCSDIHFLLIESDDQKIAPEITSMPTVRNLFPHKIITILYNTLKF